MKKEISFLILALLISMVSACGEPQAVEEDLTSDEELEDVPIEEGEAAEEDDQSIEVERGLLNVEITIPPTLLDDQDIDQTIADAKEAGVKDVTVNDDGSLTYKMSKSTHNELLEEMKEGLQENLEDIKNSGDYPSIVDVVSNDSFSEFTLVVDQEAFENSFDGFAALGLAMTGMYYQLFSGDHPDNIKVTVHVEDAESGEVFNSTVYPDAFDE